MKKKHSFFRELNLYDYILIIVIVSLAYGRSETLGAFHPIRIIGAFFLPFLLRYIKRLYNSVYRKWLFLFIFWWFYMFCSLIWTPNYKEAVVQSFHITTMMSSFLLVCYSSARAKYPIISIIIGWIVLCLITFPIAFWEFFTENHLSSGSFNEGSLLNGNLRTYAAVTFLNLNSYVVVLCCAIPFVSSILFLNGSRLLYRILTICVLMTITYIILMNASRGGVLCIVISTFFMFLFLSSSRENRRSEKILLVTVILSIVIYIVLNWGSLMFIEQIAIRLATKSSIFEDSGRMLLLEDGLKLSADMCYFGGGVYSMVDLYSTKTTNYYHYAHNFFIEFLIEYGLVITICFFSLFYFSILKLFKIKSSFSKYLLGYIGVSSILLFTIDDSYLYRSIIWIYIASAVSVSSVLFVNKNS